MAVGKRGRLSSIDMLPDEARSDVQWAIDQLNARKRTAESIRLELNERLLALGCDPIQKSSFNRYSLHLAAHGAAMLQMRQAAATFAERMDEEPDGDVGLLLIETIKSLVYSVMMAQQEGDTPDMKMLLAAANAMQKLEFARSANHKTAALKREKFVNDAADAVEKAAKEAGLSAERAAQIRRDVLGVRS